MRRGASVASCGRRGWGSCRLTGFAKAWMLEGFPKCSVRNGSIAADTSGQMGVVAL